MAKIVIIDSGIDLTNREFEGRKISGIHIYEDKAGKINIDENIKDQIGHGTAVAAILNEDLDNELFVIKIFDEEMEGDINLLVRALEYVYENVKCDIINMSVGFTEFDSIAEINNICNKLYFEKGIIMVSAFDNFDTISYPAALDTVIGVDISNEIHKKREFYYLKNSVVDILLKDSMHRVVWLDKKIMVHGTSFATPKFVKMLAKELKTTEKEKIRERLEHIATKVVDFKDEKYESKLEYFKIEEAIVFPVNKEMHTLIRFEEDLKYTMNFYDIKYSGKVGSNTSRFVPKSNHIIMDIDKIDWTGKFDTVILGHCNELSNITNRDYIDNILNNAIKYKKNVFAFDDLKKYSSITDRIKKNGNHVYYPFVTKRKGRSTLSKLHYIPKPVLAVCGTSSVQGKFTLQYMLRKKFEEQNISVGQIGTEPTSLLLGLDADFTIGYDSRVEVGGYDFISEANKVIFEVSQKNNDIIITGTQSSTIPYSYNSLKNIPLHSLEYLMAVKPDAVVLCVNRYDPIEYIKRTILTIENLFNTSVVAISVYPIDKTREKFKNKERENSEEFIEEMSMKIGKKCYLMNSEKKLGCLFDDVLTYFTTPK